MLEELNALEKTPHDRGLAIYTLSFVLNIYRIIRSVDIVSILPPSAYEEDIESQKQSPFVESSGYVEGTVLYIFPRTESKGKEIRKWMLHS